MYINNLALERRPILYRFHKVKKPYKKRLENNKKTKCTTRSTNTNIRRRYENFIGHGLSCHWIGRTHTTNN